MSESEKVILTNMCMVYDGNKVLVQNRAKGMLEVFLDDEKSEFFYYSENGKWKYELK